MALEKKNLSGDIFMSELKFEFKTIENSNRKQEILTYKKSLT